MRIPAELFQDLIGRPYERGGRGPTAYDCVGLAIEVQRRLGIPVPAYVSSEAELHAQLAGDGSMLADMRRIDAPEAGAVVLLKLGPEFHLGVLIDAYRMLHCAEQTGSVVIERILDPKWQRRIVGFYRAEDRA